MQSKETKQNKNNKCVKYYFYYVKTNVLKEVCKKTFQKVEYPVSITTWGKIRLVGVENQRKIVHKLLTSTYQPESLVSDVSSMFNDISTLLKVARCLQNTKANLSAINNRKVLHIVKFIMQAVQVLQQGATISSLIMCFIDFYLVLNENTWKAEMLEQVCLATMSMLLPAPLFEIIKRLQYFSTSKLSDDVSGFHRIINTIVEGLKWLVNKAKEFIEIPAFLDTICNKFFDFCEDNSLHVLLGDIKNHLSEVKKNSRILVQAEFREQIRVLHEKMTKSCIVDWARKSGVVHSIVQDFERLYKRVISYDNSGRLEPVCFVFEGPPGCGKSVALNYVVDLLGRTKYAHIVKDVNDGKDFYDSYNDEEVFYMDDVGQQGISQWRSFINMVSEVKYPLDCASADLKDTKFFSSEIILASTNNFMNLGGLTKQDGISNIEALWRRAFVFDFREVKFIEGSYQGRIKLRSHQTETSCTDGSFINDVPRHLQKSMRTLHPDPAFVYQKLELEPHDPHAKYKMGLWMTSIITMLHKKQVLNRSFNQTSQEDKREVQQRLAAISAWTPENDTPEVEGEFEVGPLGFRVSFIAYLLRNILREQISAIWDGIGDLGWGAVLIALMLFITITSICSVVFGKKNKTNFQAENELENVLRVASSSGIPTSHSKIMKNLKYLKFHCDSKGDLNVDSHSIGLASGHQILVTSHSIRDSRYVSIYQDHNYSHVIYDKLPFELVFSDLKEDCALIELPKNLATVFPNISHFFKTPHDGTTPLTLVVPSGSISLGTPLSGCVKPYGTYYTTNMRPEWRGFKHELNREDYFYSFRAGGLCGSVLMNNESIVGFHVAGDQNRGIGVSKLFSPTTISSISKLFEADKGFFLGLSSPKVLDNSSVLKLEQRSTAHVATTSHLKPTELFGIYPVDRFPADLHRYGKHTVKDVAKKSFSHTVFVAQPLLDFGEEWLRNELSDFVPRVLSEQEVVGGTSLLAGLNKKSSNGFGNVKDKAEYIDFINSQYTESLRSELLEIKDSINAQTPIWRYFYWVEALKDELRNEEKDGVPRSFRVGTIQHQVLMKENFGGLVEHLMSRKDQNYIMVGSNPLVEWPKMYKKLQSCTGVFAGDVAKWDGAMNNMVQDSIKKIILEKYHENSDIVSFLLEQAVRSIVLVSDDTYLTTHSMPSGHYLTAILNSLVNRFYSAMWYAQVAISHNVIPSVLKFNENIIDYVYGDDKVVGVRKENVLHYNALSMRDFFEYLGMGFTDSMKNPIVEPFDTLDNITFLKRFFVYHNDLRRIVCPLDLRTLQNSLSYYDETKDYEVVMESKILNYFREIYLHKDYEILASEFETRLLTYGLTYQRFSDSYLKNVYNRAIIEGFDPSLFYWGQVQV